jgi:hypothetical protein
MRVKTLLLLGILLIGCRKDTPLPALYATIGEATFDDFVYTNNGYLLTFRNYNKNANHFALNLKADDKNLPIHPVFPLSLRDSLFAANLIYSLVGKEGESWLLFDKTSQKKDSPKRYKLVKYDWLSRTTLKSYFILPIQGRSFANVSELQIDEKKEMMYYVDNEKNDIVSINIVDGTMKSFSISTNISVNPILSAMKMVRKDSIVHNAVYKLALNKDCSILFIIDIVKGNLYSIKEKYLIDKQFYSQDILSQIVLKERDLKDVIDVEFDKRARPIIATRNSIYLIRNNDKIPIVEDFKYGEITAISYTNNRVFFSAKSNKYNIYYIDMVK